MDADRFIVFLRSLTKAVQRWIVPVLIVLILLALGGVTNVAGAEHETVTPFATVVSIADHPACTDRIDWPIRTTGAWLVSQEDRAGALMTAHRTCAGASDCAADIGRTSLAVNITGQCSDTMMLPGWDDEWVNCDLAFSPRDDGSQRITFDLKHVSLVTFDAKRIAPCILPSLYLRQSPDISDG
jgi:hypothetical protein